MSDYDLRAGKTQPDRVHSGGSGAGFWILVAGFAIVLLFVLIYLGGGGAGDSAGPDPAPSGVAGPDIAAPAGLVGADDPADGTSLPPSAAPDTQ